MRVILFFGLLIFEGSFTTSVAGLNIGDSAYNLEVESWINSEPIRLKELQGKVVLIRWWTAPECPFCSASSVALNHWYQAYRDQGLIVIGIYHHKLSSQLSIDQVQQYVKKFHFEFPVAIDRKWKTLINWWLDTNKEWTSVSFLLDKNGVVQHIHSGGSYVKGEKEYIELERMIKLLLAEKY